MTLGGWGQRFIQRASSGSDDSALDLERNHHCNHLSLLSSSTPSPLEPFTFNSHHAKSNAPYFSWPTHSRLHDTVEDRANYFGNLQKGVLPEIFGRLPSKQQATTLLELMTIRAFQSKILRCYSLGTAVGFRIRRGLLTNILAILVFVARKVHRQWLNPMQCLPSALEGPGGVWCDVDVVEFQYYGAPAATPKEQVYNELVDGLKGSDPCIASGSQVANQETYGTLGAIVKSRTEQVTIRLVSLLIGMLLLIWNIQARKCFILYLRALDQVSTSVQLREQRHFSKMTSGTDDQWYGIFAGTNPETFVRADSAFIPFAEEFNMSYVTTVIKGIGEIYRLRILFVLIPK